MKKSNIITIVSFVGLIVFVALFLFVGKTSSANSVNISTTADGDTTQKSTTLEPSESSAANSSDSESSAPASTKPQTENEELSMPGALFIGDSRTVGLSEYAGIKQADFFANVGMSVYNIHKKPVSMPSIGKVTLDQLLTNKKYDKIYIMLGINEAGYNLDSTIEKYGELLSFIKEKQPQAFLFVQANLHVTKERSESDKVINNKKINAINDGIAKLADNKKIFYLDANVLFDDQNGNLSSEKSEDTAHLYAKYYSEWGRWINRQSASLIKGG